MILKPALTEAKEVSQEEAEVESSEEVALQEEENQETVEESQDSEPVVEVQTRRSRRERES